MTHRRGSLKRSRRTLGALAFFTLLFGRHAEAQLVVTEMMVNPKSSNDAVWEWIEVHNTGASAIDLNGYIAGKRGEGEDPTANISNASAGATIIPAGGVGVLYDAAGTNFNDQLFRQAWNLSTSVPLIAVDGWPSLANSGAGRNFGFWPDVASYNASLADDGMGTMKVSSLNGAAFSVDYTTGFPSVGANGPSIAWNGMGSYQDGANWEVSIDGVNGAGTSIPVSVSGTPINSTNDRGNPGRVPLGSAAPGLLITEVMYDPASSEPGWEWVEIYNSTGGTIDFGATPYFFHDTTSSSDLTAPNVTTGIVPANQTAVLFNSTVAVQDMVDAWDPGGALGTLFVPVDDFPSLNNGGDTIAFWDSLEEYQADAASSTPPRTTTQAIATLAFDDVSPWPANNNAASIFLANLASSPENGSNWLRSTVGDFVGTTNAAAVTQVVDVHPGGDVGSPGSFNGSGGPAFSPADFNQDGAVNLLDLAAWKTAVHSTVGGEADGDGDGDTDGADFLVWQRLVGSGASRGVAAATVPEPGALAVFFAGMLTFASVSGRKGGVLLG